MQHPWIRPSWPPAGVSAIMTTREGGVSHGPYASMNLGAHVGDDPAAVAHNRELLAQALSARLVFLKQVHGCEVITLTPQRLSALSAQPEAEADASVSKTPGVACVVLVADCLPVLFCSHDGRVVAAAHAGWRGLAAGVLEHTVRVLCEQAQCSPDGIYAWLGPCIGPRSFEVGPEVRAAFLLGDPEPSIVAELFRPGSRPDHWWADLPGLAQVRLRRLGLRNIESDPGCTVRDSQFFSYRRDGITGRMAAAICIRN